MKKVLFVVSSFITASGAERTLAHYLSGSTDDNYLLLIGTNSENISIFAEELPEKHIFYWNYQGFHNNMWSRFFLMSLESRRVKKSYLKSKARQWVERQHFECVYINNTLDNALFFGLFDRYPVVSHIHDMVRNLRPAWRMEGVRACKKADAVITPSKASAEHLYSCGVSKEKVNVVYNDVTFKQRPYHRNYDGGTLVVGFVGGAVVRKGFDYLIKLMNALEKTGLTEFGIRHLKLMMITNTPEDGYFRRCMDNLNDNIEVELHRNLVHTELQKKYLEMDIVLVPSRHDPLPGVVLEGISMGCCVLGSVCDGIPEMIGKTDMLFPKDDLEAGCRVVKNWLGKDYEEQKEMIRECQNSVFNNFSPEQKRVKVQQIIENAVLLHNRR